MMKEERSASTSESAVNQMTPERWRLVKEKLEIALGLEASEQAAYLAEIGRGDQELGQELHSLLASHEQVLTDFMDTPAIGDAAMMAVAPAPKSMLGRRVGTYQIVEQIGMGGMGEVYRAFRADDQYRKEVAIKVIRGGQDSALVVSRFKHERQILANLDHPNIARLLDGGSTEDGVLYFVMELINGQPMDEYCRGLDIPACLKLFLQVCLAVQYAHQRLIIHRDIKPGNILVTAEGTPKLLDFGIAKILDPSAAESPGLTATLFQMLTPAYASPEQIKGEPITTTADVYSLGVVLYELLTGRHPHRVAGDTAEKIARKVCDAEPKKPSSMVHGHQTSSRSSVSGADDGSSGQAVKAEKRLRKRLSGDLDNIVLRALRKEPQRRYPSVEQFAEDIRRHLENLPVIARKDTVSYRISKFVRRHKVGIAATAIVVVALLAGMAITLSEKRRADRRFNDVRSLANSLLFEIHDSIRDLPGSTPARKLIVDRALQYLDSLSAEGGNDPTLMRELAAAYERVGEVQGHYLQNNLGDTAGSLHSYQRALQTRQKIAARSSDWNDRLALARSHRMVSNQLWATGDVRGATDNIGKAISISETLAKDRPRNTDVLYELAFDYSMAGSFDINGPESYRKAMALDGAMLKLDPNNEKIQGAYEHDLLDLGVVLKNRDRDLIGALDKFQQALQMADTIRQHTASTRNVRDVAVLYSHIADLYDSLDDSLKSMENNQKALEIYQQLVTSDPQNKLLQQGIAIAYANVGTQAGVAGKKALSLESMDKSLEVMKDVVASSPQNVPQQGILAAIYEARGDNFLRWHEFQPAKREFERAFSAYEKINAGASSAGTQVSAAGCKSRIGNAALQAGEAETAAAAFQQSLDLAKPFLSAEKPDIAALYAAADSYAGLGDIESRQATGRLPANGNQEHWKKAQSWYSKSSEIWEKVPSYRRKRPKSSVLVADPERVARSLHRCEAALSFGRN
jgi:eukaryotic-like serine/threonine-protein kinase